LSNASWAGEGTLVAAIGTTETETVALIDVSDPMKAKVKEVLWRKAAGPDVKAAYPVYSMLTGRCVFVGNAAKGAALFTVQAGKPEAARPLKPDHHEPLISGLAFSPDGRYVVYSVHGPARKTREVAPPGSGPSKEDTKAAGP